jgi:MscS family membrane protein
MSIAALARRNDRRSRALEETMNPQTEAGGSSLGPVLEDLLPAIMFEAELLGLALWQWVGLLVLAAGSYVLARLGIWLARRLLRPLADRTSTTVDNEILDSAKGPGRLLVTVGLFALGSVSLGLTTAAYGLLGRIEVALLVAGTAWLALRIVDSLGALAERNLEARGRSTATAIVPLGIKTVKAFLIIMAALAMLQNVGFNVTGVLAGLGVGGLAVALAAQKSIANLFGGVSLIADQPVRVGDFCRFGDGKVGTVEEIGLRSTRVRTLDRTLVTIPNSEFSEIQLENFAARDTIRLFTMIGLRYETTPDQLRHVLSELRQLMIAHPMITESPARARFVAFGAHSLDIEIFAQVRTSDWNEFLKVREDVFLRIMQIVHDSGTGFAFPSQTIYLGRDGGLDASRTQEAERRVRAWRENNELPFPDFTDERVAELDDTIEYPPPGSATRVPRET